LIKEKHKLRGSTPFPLMSKGENCRQSCRQRGRFAYMRRVAHRGRIAEKGGELHIGGE
jgi:hypothetical protein